MARLRFKIIIKIILIILSVITLIISGIVIWYKTLPANEIIVNQKHINTFCDFDGVLYQDSDKGIYKKEPNCAPEHVIDYKGWKAVEFSYTDKKIYICEKSDSGTVIIPYDLSGNPDGEPVILPYDDLGVLTIENNLVTALNADDELIHFDMNEPSKYSKLDKLEYEDRNIHYIGDNDNVYNVYEEPWCDFIGKKGKCIYYSERNYSPYITRMNLEDNSKSVCDLRYHCSGCFMFATLNNDTITAVYMSSSTFPFQMINIAPEDQRLKYHNYDTCVKIDPDTLEVLDKRSFRRYERIIYADDNKVLTFYKGKLITYSADNWEKLSSEKRYNKKHSYSFSIYDEHIFVYDDTTGEMIDRIQIDD